ncbi:hypothetical protein [Pseudomonas sp. Y24-6]|jgi:hypothetical protein|uniref:hypothetical protein n=1 Tax=Pseudomonas sp. Y24-6 TaxID=2750013 RepID=UPI001CE2240C|nr:hypothetical protein [Pseudomonas sp. Y24-6]MCA4962469.1 hypothetical protein [Pseudomonas sp. Y24-6]
MVEVLSQFSKTSLLTTERRQRYRQTDINLFKAVFFSAFVRFFAVLLATAVSPAEGNP